MTIEECIVSRLKTDATITAKVKQRIRPIAFTQADVRPCIAYQVISTESFDTFGGSADWQKVTMQIDVLADTYAQCKDVARLIRNRLNNYSGTIEDIEIGFAKWKEDTDLTEPPDIGQEKVIHRLSSNYLILFREG